MTFQWQVWNELAVHFLNAGLDVACKSGLLLLWQPLLEQWMNLTKQTNVVLF